MRIQINGNYYLESDSYCFWVSKKVTSKNGTERFDNYNGYFGSLEMCIEDFCNTRIGRSEATNFTQLMKEVKELKKEIKEFKNTVEHNKTIICREA